MIYQIHLCSVEPVQNLASHSIWHGDLNHILIQYYAITGFVTGSPREVLKQSFRANLITGDEWIEMLKVKNQLAHDYDGVIVKEHCQTIIHEYIDKLYDFKTVVETLLKEDK